MLVEPKDIFRKKFLFSIFALTIAVFVTIWLHYEGSVFVQLFGIVVTGFLVAQAYVDAKAVKVNDPK